jgi:hypothetical protein
MDGILKKNVHPTSPLLFLINGPCKTCDSKFKSLRNRLSFPQRVCSPNFNAGYSKLDQIKCQAGELKTGLSMQALTPPEHGPDDTDVHLQAF